MPIYFGSSKIKDVYFGNQKIKEVYYGITKVYPSGPYNPGQVLYTSPTVASSSTQTSTTETLDLLGAGKYRIDIIGGGGGGGFCYYSDTTPHYAGDGGCGGTLSVYLTINNPLTLTLTTGCGGNCRMGRLSTSSTTVAGGYNGANSTVTAPTGLSLVASAGTGGKVSGNGKSNAPGVMGTCSVSGSTTAAEVTVISNNPNNIISITENRAITSSEVNTDYSVRNINWPENDLMGSGGGCCYTTRSTVMNVPGGQGYIKVTFVS